jgi:hypothetical protein
MVLMACAEQVRVTAVGERKERWLISPLQFMAGAFNLVFCIVIGNKLKILLSRFVEINGFTFMNVTRFCSKFAWNRESPLLEFHRSWFLTLHSRYVCSHSLLGIYFLVVYSCRPSVFWHSTGPPLAEWFLIAHGLSWG